VKGEEFDKVSPSPMEFENLILKIEIQLPKAHEDFYLTTTINYHQSKC